MVDNTVKAVSSLASPDFPDLLPEKKVRTVMQDLPSATILATKGKAKGSPNESLEEGSIKKRKIIGPPSLPY